MAAGVIIVAVLNVVLRTGDQDFIDTPDIFDVMGKLTHQNVKAVGVFYPPSWNASFAA